MNKKVVVLNSYYLGLVLLLGSHFANAQLANVLATITQLEQQLQARVGVAVFDIDSNERILHNGDDLFPLSSTFKTLACAALLHRVVSGQEDLQRRVTFTKEKLVSYSPATQSKVGAIGMTLAELCEATITLSDNTAGNLILEAIGGPQGLTGFLRTIGDEVTRLDRWEPELNESSPGDARDTTSPNAMANTIQTLLFTDALSAAARLQLETWLRGNAVGDALLRAAIPENWSIGDKTGAGGFGSPSIAAVLWPPQRGPIIAAIYITETDATFGERNAAIAAIGLAISRSVLAP
jgi:beta-lactamase class A